MLDPGGHKVPVPSCCRLRVLDLILQSVQMGWLRAVVASDEGLTLLAPHIYYHRFVNCYSLR